jgi:protein-S-isoprenylcysteine O-methyltransferase Ste14
MHLHRPWFGHGLVGLQFALLAVLAMLTAPGLAAGRLNWGVVLTAAAAAALGLWALASNRPGNFNIRPVPREGGALVRHGPYRWIRHPMYSALLLAGLAAAWLAGSAWAWAALLALAAVLVIKAGVEERAMVEHHPGYVDYQRISKRFVPGLY